MVKEDMAMIQKLRFGDGKQGWTFDYKQLSDITMSANDAEDVSMEQAEAVILAMVEAGFIVVEKRPQPEEETDE